MSLAQPTLSRSTMVGDRIEDFLDRFGAAWNTGDAASFAALFIEDATYVTWQGQWVRGREEIARMRDFLSHGCEADAPLRVKPLSVRALGPAVRLVVAAGGNGEVQTFTLILQGGRWVCAAVQNTAIGLPSD
jgi:uncharacterized protein (TIGR02246 family)